MGRFKKRIVSRWRDIWKLFEAVSAQEHGHEAFAFISNVLSRSAGLFPKGDGRRTMWDKYCTELVTLNNEVATKTAPRRWWWPRRWRRKFRADETPIPTLRHLFRTVEHAGYRMYQLLHSIEDDEKREAAIVQWESEMAVAFRLLVYASVAHWCPDRQEHRTHNITIDMNKQGAYAISSEHYPMQNNRAHRKYGSNPR